VQFKQTSRVIHEIYLILSCFLFQGHQYETVLGFVCEAFGYIPKTGETIKVILEKENQEEPDEYTEAEPDHQDHKEKHQIFKVEVCLSASFFQFLGSFFIWCSILRYFLRAFLHILGLHDILLSDLLKSLVVVSIKCLLFTTFCDFH